MKDCFDKTRQFPGFYYDYLSNTFKKCPPECKSCSSSSLSNGMYVCEACADNYQYYYKNNGYYKCVQTCPHFILGGTFNCIDDCQLYIQNSVECVHKCYSTNEFLNEENQTCMSECPENLYTIDEQKKCVSSCLMNGLFEKEDEKKCVEKCESDFVLERNPDDSAIICRADCQNHAFINTMTNYCVKECPEGSVYVDNKCIDSCPEDTPFIFGDTKKCVDNCLNEIISSNLNNYKYTDLSTNTCVSRCQENDFAVEDNLHCVKKCPSDSSFEYNKKCVKKCSDINKFEIVGSKQCVDSCPSDYLQVDGYSKCYSSCPDEFPIEVAGENKCIDKCSPPTPFYNPEGSICLDNCLNANPPKHQYRNECVADCPEDNMIVNEYNICVKNLHLKENANETEITIPINETIDWVDEHVVDYSNVNHTIKGDGFILQVYPSDNPLDDYHKVSEVDFSRCEIVLRRIYQIPKKEPLIIVKYDFIHSDLITNQVEYSIYDNKGNKLNTSVCNEINTNISYPINEDLDIDLEKGENMFIKGIDVFNAEDDYFNDICSTYSKKRFKCDF